MIQELSYDGFTTAPSDYECSDGQLAAAINLIPEDGALHPLRPATALFTLNTNDKKVFLHKPTGYVNYIVISGVNSNGTYTVSWISSTDLSTRTNIVTLSEVKDVASVGNTLVFATAEGLRYVLWKDGGYTYLGEKPPFVSIAFGVYKEGTLDDTTRFSVHSIDDDYDAKTVCASLTQNVYGLLLASVAENVTSQGRFYQPFFVRYAYRLFDGSYYWHSSPILMLPTVLPPVVKVSFDSISSISDWQNVKAGWYKGDLTLDVPYFTLAYRILTDGAADLKDWSDIVAGIDVFVSAPIYTYDQSADIGSTAFTTKVSMVSRLDPSYVEGGLTSNDAFLGHYGDAVNGTYKDYYLSDEGSNAMVNVVNIPRHSEFVSNVRDCANFYKVAEIDVKDVASMSELKDLPLLFTDMTSLRERTAMTDDYRSHCKLVPSQLYAFNSRLNMADIKIYPAEPFPLRSLMAWSYDNSKTLTSGVRITVWSRINGKRCYAIHDGLQTYSSDRWCDPANNFPRYIFYPDSSAYKMEIYVSSSQIYTIDLKQHDFLNGAYFYNLGAGIKTSSVNATSETGVTDTSVEMPSKIYTSEVGNPFMFLASNINTVGDGTIIGLSSAVRALSEGQFGQFPLYAFSTEGVWALSVSSTGTYSSVQPITRDVCINAAGITQLDDTVMFPTNRGLMQVAGSSTLCITDMISSAYPFDVTELPYFEKLHEMIHSGSDTCLPTVPFTVFIKDCRMLYDYVHQRIYVYNPNYTYAYVLSLKSKAWGMTFSRMQDTVNSYPEACAIIDDGTSRYLADYSDDNVDNTDKVGCLFATRPIKFGSANVLKTISGIIQRGFFAKGNVTTVLYGSRDCRTWHLIWSSKDHYLRGFRGTPYKYFRIAGTATLSANESIFGASVDFEQRLTNQIR